MTRFRLRWSEVVVCEAVVEAPDAGYARDMLDDPKNNVPQAITLGESVEHVTVEEVA